jgi:alpha-beta hydrolase superfamily lysophospholipase
MKLTRRWKIFGALLVAGLILGIILVWSIGSVLIAPANHPVAPPPENLHAQSVTFPSASGATLHGWFISGKPGQGAVVLMHGNRGDRRQMLSLAEFFSRQGFAVLLFDFQAHGESAGKHITVGFLESRDATAAVKLIRQKLPGEKIGVIGFSLGAASALLAEPPLLVDALVLQSSFPTIRQAVEDRMVERLGFIGKMATPLLTLQMHPRLGFGPDDLQPIEHARTNTVPKFFIAGTEDKLTTIAESKSLFAAATEPKQCWWVDGAAHVNMHAFARAEYERRVLEFLAPKLQTAASE